MASSWRKTKPLGKGSFGRVDLATNLSCSVSVAVKSSKTEESSSLENEARFLKRLRGNPYVIQCYGKDTSQEEEEDGSNSKRFNLLMEYAPGGTLDGLIKGKNDISESESVVAYYSYLLLRGLSAIHEIGIVHCDIKPENVLVFDTGHDLKHLKLADFGLARYVWERERRRGFNGTPLYGSPEAIKDYLHGRATDVWSFGMTVLEMMYHGESMRSESLSGVELMELTLDEGPPEIPEYVTEDCRDFLSKCLAMEVEDRPSASELLKHDFITRNMEIIRMKHPGLELDQCLDGPKTNPFGSWNDSRRLFSASAAAAPQPSAAAPQCQQLQDCGNAGDFGGPKLIRDVLAT